MRAWCSGSTTVSKAVSDGSNPSTRAVSVAQLVERQVVTLVVADSSSARHPRYVPGYGHTEPEDDYPLLRSLLMSVLPGGQGVFHAVEVLTAGHHSSKVEIASSILVNRSYGSQAQAGRAPD